MPSFTGVYVEPGGYSKFKPTTAFPVVPGGLRVVAIVGTGSSTKSIAGELVTMTVSATCSLAHLASDISAVIDDNYYSYTKTTDFAAVGGALVWQAAPVTVTGTATEPMTVYNQAFITTLTNGVTPTLVTVTFTVTLTTAASIAAYLNADANWGESMVASGTTGALSISTETCATINSSILIGNGAANSILGFVGGGIYETPKRPYSSHLFYVDYTYAKVSADYDPLYYYNMQDIVNDCGDVTTVNTLPMGAEVAFENGAQVVLACQLNPASITACATVGAIRLALTSLEAKACNIVTVMTGDSSIFSYVKAHVDKMSTTNNRSERTSILGLDDSPSISTIEGYATALADKRVMLVYPTTAKRIIAGTEESIGSYLLAAALAGIRCNPSYDVAEPLTKKQVIGFTEITDNLIRSQKNDLASHGVCIVESQSGVARVRHALTTDMTTVQNQEFSITELTDYTGQVTREILEQMYVGAKILSETPLMIAATLRVILQNLIDRGIITAFTGVSASQNGTDPRQIDVRFAFSPVYPLNWIFVEYSIQV